MANILMCIVIVSIIFIVVSNLFGKDEIKPKRVSHTRVNGRDIPTSEANLSNAGADFVDTSGWVDREPLNGNESDAMRRFINNSK